VASRLHDLMGGQAQVIFAVLPGAIEHIRAGELRALAVTTAGCRSSPSAIAVREYGARAIVINVVGNDFDERHTSYGLGPGFWLYSPDSDGTLRLRLNDYDPGWSITILRESALRAT
jgi:Tripartite tricarboxylate transporter family receptor